MCCINQHFLIPPGGDAPGEMRKTMAKGIKDFKQEYFCKAKVAQNLQLNDISDFSFRDNGKECIIYDGIRPIYSCDYVTYLGKKHITTVRDIRGTLAELLRIGTTLQGEDCPDKNAERIKLKLTKEKAIAEHQKMWNWIIDQYKTGRRIYIMNLIRQYMGLHQLNICGNNFICEYIKSQYPYIPEKYRCNYCPACGSDGCMNGLHKELINLSFSNYANTQRQIVEACERIRDFKI